MKARRQLLLFSTAVFCLMAFCLIVSGVGRGVGVSMLPTMGYDQLYIAVPLWLFPKANLTGEVVVFKVEDVPHPVTHRVIADNGSRLLTKGDNNQAPDVWNVTRDQVVGVVVIPSTWGVAAVMVLPFAGCMVSIALFIKAQEVETRE